MGGAQAGAKYNQSLTYATYPNAVAATPVMTNNQIISALNAGKLILAAEDGKVRVEQDINSLVTYTTDIGKVYRKNRVILPVQHHRQRHLPAVQRQFHRCGEQQRGRPVPVPGGYRGIPAGHPGQ